MRLRFWAAISAALERDGGVGVRRGAGRQLGGSEDAQGLELSQDESGALRCDQRHRRLPRRHLRQH